MNVFNDPMASDGSQEREIELATMLATVAQEVSQCPNLLAFLELQATSEAHNLLNIQAQGSVHTDTLRTVLAETSGKVAAYKFLYELAANLSEIQADLHSLTTPPTDE